MSSPALFIDRDGTISEEIGYVNHPARYQVYPYAAQAVRLLNEAGWRAILVTNQSGVARGYFAEALVLQIHDILTAELARGGARLDAVYYCPHHPTAGAAPYRLDCDCRKPKTGLVQRAGQEFDLDLARSWVVGDRYSDIGLAHNAGMRGAFVLSGYGRGEWEYQRHKWPSTPDMVAENLLEVVENIIA